MNANWLGANQSLKPQPRGMSAIPIATSPSGLTTARNARRGVVPTCVGPLSRDARWSGLVTDLTLITPTMWVQIMSPLPSAPGPCRACGARTAPTRGGGSCRRAAGMLSGATGQRKGELLVTHSGGPRLLSLDSGQFYSPSTVFRDEDLEAHRRVFCTLNG